MVAKDRANVSANVSEEASSTVAETMAKAKDRIAHYQEKLQKLTAAVQSGNEHAVKDVLAADEASEAS